MSSSAKVIIGAVIFIISMSIFGSWASKSVWVTPGDPYEKEFLEWKNNADNGNLLTNWWDALNFWSSLLQLSIVSAGLPFWVELFIFCMVALPIVIAIIYVVRGIE